MSSPCYKTDSKLFKHTGSFNLHNSFMKWLLLLSSQSYRRKKMKQEKLSNLFRFIVKNYRSKDFDIPCVSFAPSLSFEIGLWHNLRNRCIDIDIVWEERVGWAVSLGIHPSTLHCQDPARPRYFYTRFSYRARNVKFTMQIC